MKNKPTKKQLVDRLEHFENGLKALVDGPFLSAEDFHQEMKSLLTGAPSIDPQPKDDCPEPAVNA